MNSYSNKCNKKGAVEGLNKNNEKEGEVLNNIDNEIDGDCEMCSKYHKNLYKVTCNCNKNLCPECLKKLIRTKVCKICGENYKKICYKCLSTYDVCFKSSCNCFFCSKDVQAFYYIEKNLLIKDPRDRKVFCPNCNSEIRENFIIDHKCFKCKKYSEKMYKVDCICETELCKKCYDESLINDKCPYCKTKIKRLCCICQRDAEFVLSCGCYYCRNDIQGYYDLNESFDLIEIEENRGRIKCKFCGKPVNHTNYIKPECPICLEHKGMLFYFPCQKCNQKLCKACLLNYNIAHICHFCGKRIKH